MMPGFIKPDRYRSGKESIVFNYAALSRFVVWVICVLCPLFQIAVRYSEVLAEDQLISDSADFFPDQRGNQWRYRGRMTEGLLEQIADTTFENISTVKGEDTIEGLKVTVFHDSNPGNQGPSDSYYLKDSAGIRYYGSKPGTELERQLIPYQIIRFPIEISSSFQQLDRKNLNLGLDLDRDKKNERVDVHAVVTVVGRESVSVPMGTYPNALEIEARMDLSVHLSSSGILVRGSDTMTAWFVKGIGLVKYLERQTIPLVGSGQTRLIHIVEELEEASLVANRASLKGGKPPAKGVFTRHPLNHKLGQIFFPSGLFPYPR